MCIKDQEFTEYYVRENGGAGNGRDDEGNRSGDADGVDQNERNGEGEVMRWRRW